MENSLDGMKMVISVLRNILIIMKERENGPPGMRMVKKAQNGSIKKIKLMV